MTTPSPFIFWLKELIALNSRKLLPASGPVYAAVFLILVVAVFVFALAGNISQTKQSQLQSVQTMPPELSQTALSKPPVTSSAVNAGKAASQPAAAPKESPPVQKLADAVLLEFGWQQHPVFHDWRYHNGIDIRYGKNEPVKAVYSGEVSRIYKDNDYGLTVVIVSGKTTVQYSSLTGSNVAVGQTVSAGEGVGKAGGCSLEPYEHLHLIVKIGDKLVNPRELSLLAD